jgi:hypothetical protein
LPVVFNNQAPLDARALEAVPCVVRTVCDQASESVAYLLTAKNVLAPGTKFKPPGTMVASVQALLQQYEANQQAKHSNERTAGLRLMTTGMDGVASGDKDCTDDAIQCFLCVRNTATENLLMLHHAGPTYHTVSNAAMRLSHCGSTKWTPRFELPLALAPMTRVDALAPINAPSAMNVRLWEEVLDTCMAIRKLLTVHRWRLGLPQDPATQSACTSWPGSETRRFSRTGTTID